MAYIETDCKDKIAFEQRVNVMISGWEEMMKCPGREKEYENVIWGAHRILNMLKVEITENNDIL